ncbi:MAG: ATP-binding protein [Candidatus Cloacimonetes bacterium]|nr:ATP-binding protein [Candidatus Cloacimonadota bacterium]
MKKCFLLLYIVFTISGCRIARRIDTHEFYPLEVNRHDTIIQGWIFADLKGDDTEYLISWDSSSSTTNSIYVEDTKGKVISQINSLHKFRSVTVLPDPKDNGRWMFYTSNNGNTVFLEAAKYNWQIPLQRETKRFESIARNDAAMHNPDLEYYGQISPVILDDLDGDGKLELLCKTVDGFTANPRGLVVYDFATGKIKWQFQTPCNLSSVLWDDFDNNGKKEIITSNYAFKNTQATINGIDDASGWIIVLSTQGKLLATEKLFSSYGHVSLNAADTDLDGTPEIYVVNSTWGSENYKNAVSVFKWTGTRLQRTKKLELASTLERYQHPEFLQEIDNSGDFRLYLVDKSKGLMILDDELNSVPHNYKGFVKAIWGIGDLDHDGRKEIILQTDDDYLEVINYRAVRLARLKNPFPEDNVFRFSLVKTGFETSPILSIGSSREIRYFRYQFFPVHKLLYNLFIHYAPFISLFLVLVILLLHLRYQKIQKTPMMGANYLSDGIILIKKLPQILHCNRSALMLAKNSEDPTAKNLQKAFPPLYQALINFIGTGQEIYELPEGVSLGKEGNYAVTLFRVKSPQMRYLITFHRIIETEDSIQKQMQWAEIARSLSHHVRRHITNIILSLDALGKDDDPVRKEYYEIITGEIEKVRTFTHAFQRFTELKDYELKLQDIIPSMEHCVARTRLPQNIQLVKSYGLKSIPAFIEPIRFEEAVTNTLNNAIEAMPEGGILHIMVKVFPGVSSPQGNLRVLVEIEDNGIGIPNKYKEDIWKPFFTTNQSGTGIGIPETKKIIDSLGGIMDIQSEEGVGTTVSFWLKGNSNE